MARRPAILRAAKQKSDRGRLVKKHWEKKSIVDYRDALGKVERGRGIYVLYRKGKIYYVGLSRASLRARIRAHATRDRHRGKWDSFSFYQITRVRYIKDIESLLLRIFRPTGNRAVGKFNRKHNLAHKRRRL
jgi:hypothetical protein